VQPRILTIIPAYNEGQRIGDVVHRVLELHPGYDVVVVNDGSRDNTAQMARSAGAKIISHPFNLGYGVAIQTGYKFALAKGYDFVVQMDGDGQHDPAFISQVLAPAVNDETDFVLRSHRDSHH
jgi:glycosyltransferase involved in cell wall biosynthesis